MENEKRLISLDEAIAKVKDDGILGEGYSDDERIDDVCDILESCEIVDAVEVVHSSWILNNDGSGTCKNCHRTTKDCWDYDRWMNYCPNCGSLMDGGGVQ